MFQDLRLRLYGVVAACALTACLPDTRDRHRPHGYGGPSDYEAPFCTSNNDCYAQTYCTSDGRCVYSGACSSSANCSSDLSVTHAQLACRTVSRPARAEPEARHRPRAAPGIAALAG